MGVKLTLSEIRTITIIVDSYQAQHKDEYVKNISEKLHRFLKENKPNDRLKQDSKIDA